jgi:uncharacterized protein (TIGR00255 family)
MIKSMTGFASRADELEQASIGVTIRSVNHRFLDVQVRVPQLIAHLESRVRALVQQRMARGRVEVGITVHPRRLSVLEVELNEALIVAMNAALERARAARLIEGSLEVSDLLRMPQALTVRERPLAQGTPEAIALDQGVEASVEAAIADLETMRVREGAHLQADLAGRRAACAEFLARVETAADEGREALETRVRQRINELPADLQGDPVAVAQEVVRLAGRSDISEEVVRFRAHLSQWTTLEESGEPCGRKMDFLLQEMNREVNTIGSKADGLRVSETIVALKAELEKVREQAQNVE